MNYQKSYSPMRPIKSFQDLEVYQRLLAISVTIAKKMAPSSNPVPLALNMPVKIATAHSLRFSDQTKAIQILEEIMLECNILVVYLEQYRDLENPSAHSAGSGQAGSGQIEPEFFAEQIKNILTTRGKILRLQFSWKKFSEQKYKQNAK